jgi:histidyl-tRNA synthetase
LCGKNYCCFGFTGSLLEVKKAMEEAKLEVVHEQKSEVFLVPLGELASKKSLRLFRDLVLEKVLVYDNFGDSGVKNQLKAAESFKAPIALIMGQKEAVDEMVILRDVKSGMQEIISYDKIVEEVKKRLGR